jgi:hypothetical protein
MLSNICEVWQLIKTRNSAASYAWLKEAVKAICSIPASDDFTAD